MDEPLSYLHCHINPCMSNGILYLIWVSICQLQWNFSGSNTDCSFTTAISNSFLSPLEKIPKLQILDNLGDFLFYIENGVLCVLIRIASMRRF